MNISKRPYITGLPDILHFDDFIYIIYKLWNCPYWFGFFKVENLRANMSVYKEV